MCSGNDKFNSGTYYDSYSLEFGIRTISWSGTENNKQAWQINSEPFYCAGVNRHEDFPVIGRGIDLVIEYISKTINTRINKIIFFY